LRSHCLKNFCVLWMRERRVPDSRGMLTFVRSFSASLVRHLQYATPTIEEILEPFRTQVADSGISDEELRDLFS
jgi:hypothetical protein